MKASVASRECCGHRRRAVALAVFCLVLLHLAAAASARAQGVGVTVDYLNGRAQVMDEEGTEISLEEGQRLSTPVMVRVEQGARLGLVFPDESVFRLAGPAMALVRDAIVLPEERIMDVELSQGQGWLGVRPFSGSRDTVRLVLPASLLVTQATQCQVRVGADRRVMVAVFGGQVRVMAGRNGTEQDGADEDLAGADMLLEGGDSATEPLIVGGEERVLGAGEQALLSLAGKVGEKRSMTNVEQRDSAWGAWNRARDRERGLELQP